MNRLGTDDDPSRCSHAPYANDANDKETMKTRFLLFLTGLMIGFTAPAITADLPGDAKTLDGLIALGRKYQEAYNQNNAAALADLFTQDAMLVTPEGLASGRQAIERWYASEFQKWHAINHIVQGDTLKVSGQGAWAVGEWWTTLQGPNGPVQVRGYYSGVYVLEGDTWKIRMSMYNVSGRISLNPPSGSPAGTP
jgi:uncharacterized protein (TIGR02246 family)